MRNGKREMKGTTKLAAAGAVVFGCMVAMSAVIESGAPAAPVQGPTPVQERAHQPFFAVATGPSVAECAEAAQAFDTNRTVEQAWVVDLACQEAMNRPDQSPACEQYANALWVASGKFQEAMEATEGRGRNFQEAMEMHKAVAREAAPLCG